MTPRPSPEAARVWEDAVFCLVCPDAVRRHLVRAVLDRFRAIGLRAAGWRVVDVTAREVDAIAEIQAVGAGGAFRYRALDALFSLGPSLALRLADELGRPPSELYAAADELKGASLPSEWEHGTLRRDLGGVNSALSLLHVSDTPARSAEEAAVLLGAAEPAFEDEGLDGLVEALEASQPRETRGFAEVLAAVRGRVAAYLWADLSETGRRLVAELARSGELAQPGSGALVAAELAPPASAHPLVAVLRATFDPSEPPADMPWVRRLLDAHGLGLDPWEDAVLATSVYFEPVRTPVATPSALVGARRPL